MMDKVFHQPYVVPGIKPLEPDPVAGENVVIGEVYAQEEGDAEDES